MAGKKGKSGGVAGKVMSMTKSWRKARETTKKDEGLAEFIPVSPGMYDMQLVKAEAGIFGDAHKMHLQFCVVGDTEEHGSICHSFEGYGSEDRDVWMQRLLIALGSTDDQLDEIEDENDLVDLFGFFIENLLTCKVRVTEKDGYTNLRVRKLCEVDEEYLVDPADLFADNNEDNSETKDDDDDDGEDDFKEGDRVVWKGRKGELTGVITGFTDDDKAKVKADGSTRSSKVSIDKLDWAPEKAEEEAPKEEPKEEPKTKPTKSKSKFSIGARVFTEEYGDEFPGTIKSISPKGGAKAILVEFDDGDTDNFGDDDLTLVPSDNGSSDDDSGDDDEGSEELAVGDRVVSKFKGKETSGEVVELKDGKVRIRFDGVRKPMWVQETDVDFEIDD